MNKYSWRFTDFALVFIYVLKHSIRVSANFICFIIIKYI